MATTDLATREDVITPEILERHIETILLGIPEYAEQPAALELCGRAQSLVVAGAGTKADAAELGREIAGHKKRTAAHYQPFTQAADLLHSRIVDLRKAAISPLDAAGTRVANSIMAYDQEMERQRRAEIAKAEEEARQKRIADQRRIEEEALARAKELEAEGQDMAAADELDKAASAVEELKAEPLQVVLPPMPPPQKAKGTANRTSYTFEVVDKLALCRAAIENPAAYLHFLCPDEKEIRARVNRGGTDAQIPGVVIREETNLHFRAGK